MLSYAQHRRKKAKLADICLLLKAAINALGKVGIILHVNQNDLPAVLALLPALKNPTVSPLSGNFWFAVNTVVDELTARELIPRLKETGAEGIVEYPLNKVVL